MGKNEGGGEILENKNNNLRKRKVNFCRGWGSLLLLFNSSVS